MKKPFQKEACVKGYPLDSLQIYFPASLELQEELIKHGFYVPSDPSKKIKMPIPIIYANFRGWLKQPEPLTTERLILPKWLGISADKLGWKHTLKGGKNAYFIPPEEVYTDVCISDDTITFRLIVNGYHLERTSYRGSRNPEGWNNWAMLYIDLTYIDKLIELIKDYLSKSPYKVSYTQVSHSKPQLETQQNGKEVTYWIRVEVKDFELCMGCFDLVQKYLYFKAKEHCKYYPSLPICTNINKVIENLKLKLKYSPNTNTFAKVGVAKIAGKRPQIMIKLASNGPEKIIQGVLKSMIKGKARGDLIYCDHKEKNNYISLNLIQFYKALEITKNYVDKLPKDL